MSTASKIEWTDTTWNPVTGCTRVSAGCDHCYAVKQSYRNANIPATKARYEGLTTVNARGARHFNGTIRLQEDRLEEPLRWKKPRRVFVNSMSDLFHEKVPLSFLVKVLAVMALARRHTFQILTKRPQRAASVLDGLIDGIKDAMSEMASDWPNQFAWPLPNVWLGTSVENQETADERIPHLLRCPAAVRFLSCEPLLSSISIPNWTLDPNRCGDRQCGDSTWDHLCDLGARDIQWVIVGGESGPGARPYHLEWGLSVIEQCRAAGVPVFHKQVGSNPYYQGKPLHVDRKGGQMDQWPEAARVREWPH
jgi:protein gp37